MLQQHQHCSLLFPITVLLQSVLFGWLWVNIFASMPEDVFHQDFNGLGKHLLECIYVCIERQTKAEATRLKGVILEHIRILHGTNVPSKGLYTERQLLALVKGLLDVPCLAVVGARPLPAQQVQKRHSVESAGHYLFCPASQ